MKRMALILVVMIMLASAVFADKEYQDSVSVSFIAGIMANFGFSTQPVAPTVKPTTTVPGDRIEFEYRPESQDFATDVYYIYYQIFTPNDFLELSVQATPLSSDGTELEWTDMNGNLSCDDNSFSILEKSLIAYPEPLYNSIPFQLVISADEIEATPDFFGTGTSAREYTGSITLRIETQ